MSTLLNRAVTAFASFGITTAIVAFANPAHADVAVAAPQVKVQVADLNLASLAGQTTAMRRIRAAADQVCASDNGRLTAQPNCRDQAIAEAARELHDRTAVL